MLVAVTSGSLSTGNWTFSANNIRVSQLLLLFVSGEIIINNTIQRKKEAQHPENTNWRNLHFSSLAVT